MTCPFHDEGQAEESLQNDQSSERGLDERSFKRAALTIGSASALSTAVGLYGLSGAAAADTPSDVSVAERNNRQHAWDAYELYDEDKETSVPPESQLLLNMDYLPDRTPDSGDRQRVEEALNKLEEAFGWGHEGLLFTIGYSPAYFERFGGDGDYPLPRGLDPNSGAAKPGLLTPDQLLSLPGVTLEREEDQDNPEPDGETGVVAGDYDAVVHMSSDNPEHVLAAEQALWEGDKINGVEFDAPFDGVFTRPEEPPDRRVGFVGHDTVSENLEKRTEFDDTKIPDDAVLSMGFNDLFRNSVPRETNATMLEDQRLVIPKPPGAFAQGSIQHLSKLDINLGSNVGDDDDGWYDDHESVEGRINRMFSPEHDTDNTGTVGDELGNSNAPGDKPMRNISDGGTDIAEKTQEHANDEGVVGHVQKVARARFDLNNRLVNGGNGGLPSDHPARLEVQGDERGEEYDADLPGHDGDQEAEQVMLRRDFAGVSNEKPGNHFNALMRFNPYMAYMRAAMNGVEFDTADGPTGFGLDGDARIEHGALDVSEENNGIVGYLTTRRRANYVVPPITMRALPPAHAARPPMEIQNGHDPREKDSVTVVIGDGTGDYENLYEDAGAPGTAPGDESSWVEYDNPGDIDPETIRFGDHWVVNRGGGTTPSGSSYDSTNEELRLMFDVSGSSGAGFTTSSIRARLFAKTDDRFPVFATVNL